MNGVAERHNTVTLLLFVIYDKPACFLIYFSVFSLYSGVGDLGNHLQRFRLVCVCALREIMPMG